ncbi:MAG: hypothetical protein COB53_05600 [Elusimicrobia bacterium]|nr:MAG: hypothetical protein COB53_05600 [Elusimicrobiota bacterium]
MSKITFEELGLSEELCRAVAGKGYKHPTPIQTQSIPAILEARDVFGGAQTGTGKTASFTLPLLQMNARRAKGGKHIPRSLIMVPTRELAAQVSESVRGYGAHLNLRSAMVAGGMPIRAQIKNITRGVDILIATPGRLLDLIDRKTVSLKELNTLVLDEADRMLDMGFMPDIQKILKHLPHKRQTLMFSATSSREIEKLAGTILKQPVRVQVGELNQVADNVSHTVYFVHRKDKPEVIARLFKNDSWGQVLIFTKTKAGADELKELLRERDLSSRVIHGGKPQTVRTQTLKRFKTGKVKILIATDVAARGLDIDSLPFVVNYDLPQAPDDYIHRIGRTGRAGSMGSAISLVSQLERHSLARIERQIKKHFKREKLEGIEEAGAPNSRPKRFNPFKGRVTPGARRSSPPSRRPRREDRRDDTKPYTKPWDKKKSDGPKKGRAFPSKDEKKSFKKVWDKKKPDAPKKPYGKKKLSEKDEKKPFKKVWDKKKPGAPKKPYGKKKISDKDEKKSFKKPWDKKKKFSDEDEKKAFPSKRQKKSFEKMWNKDTSDKKGPRHPQKKTGFEKFYKKKKKDKR